MKDLVLFGAGKIGLEAAQAFMKEHNNIAYFVDNAEEKWGTELMHIPVISLSEYISMKSKYQLVVTVRADYEKQIREQLSRNDISDFTVFRRERDITGERLVSYCANEEMEDIILYHVLRDVDDIFYIDIGSNDPFKGSVTKLLYDMKNAHGINVEPQRKLYEITVRERPRDINLCVAIGNTGGISKLFYQGGLSTIVKRNVWNEDCYSEEIEIVTLKSVCEKYVKEYQNICFLKIDVEGAEKSVLEGCDFNRYRPWIIVIESTEPMTDIPNFMEWESILLSAGYHFVQMTGVNRYYVANEKRDELDKKFEQSEKLKYIYNIYYANI